MNQKRKMSIIFGVIVALGIAGGAYTFTASNTVPATTVGAARAQCRVTR